MTKKMRPEEDWTQEMNVKCDGCGKFVLVCEMSNHCIQEKCSNSGVLQAKYPAKPYYPASAYMGSLN